MLSASTLNVAVSGLRFFYAHVLERSIAEVEKALPRPQQPKQYVRVYSLEQIRQLLDHGCINPVQRVFLMTVYGAGLRLNEACHLKVEDIESSRMMIRVDQGKGARDRYTILSPWLLEELRRYWGVTVHGDGCFPRRGTRRSRSSIAVRRRYSMRRWRVVDCRTRAASMRCGIALRPICWRQAWRSR
jgi:integrase